MEELLTLEEVKAHLRLDALETVDDLYLSGLILAAVRTCEHRTGQRMVGGAETVEGRDLDVARVAALLLIAHWYVNREAGDDIPPAVDAVLSPLKIWVV